MTATMYFFSSESDICSLLHLQKLFRYFQAFSAISLGKFSDYGIVQERSPERKRLITINSYQALFKSSITKIYAQLKATFSSSAKM